LKRWHPDLYPSGTPEHAEATQMAEMLNEAYAAIAQAPLRYYTDRDGGPVGRVAGKNWRPSPGETRTHREREGLDERAMLSIARIEYGIRFVCGVLFGILLCFDLVFLLLARVTADMAVLMAECLGITLACGFGSARYGDKFWSWIIRRPGGRRW
jgi:hypothetical protein